MSEKSPASIVHQPLVSVVIPTWNAANYLPATLETVFSQTWPNIQIIVVDDGSTDETSELLASYQSRLTVISLKNSGGPSRPRNKGIEHSQGEFIAFFDSDDLMDPDKISRAMAVFTKNPDVGLVCSDFRSIDPADIIIKNRYLTDYKDFRRDLNASPWVDTSILPADKAFQHLLRGNFVGTSSVICRRDILLEVGPFDESMKNADDIDMWLRVARHGHNFAFIDQVLHSYRLTPGGVTARGARRIPAIITGLENQLPHCRRQADRRFIIGKVRELHFEKAWQLRQDGQLDQAINSYRAGLAMKWSWRPFVGLTKTRILILKKGSD